MKFKAWLGSTLPVLLLAVSLQEQSRETLLKYVGENPDWSSSGSVRQFDENNLEGLAGKTAPTIKRYGVTGVTVQDWNSKDGRVHLTLYEMVDPSAAYGLFTFGRNPNQPDFSAVPLGTEGFRTGLKTYFWQSKYVVKLEGDPKPVENLAGLISQNIFGRS